MRGVNAGYLETIRAVCRHCKFTVYRRRHWGEYCSELCARQSLGREKRERTREEGRALEEGDRKKRAELTAIVQAREARQAHCEPLAWGLMRPRSESRNGGWDGSRSRSGWWSRSRSVNKSESRAPDHAVRVRAQ